MKISLIGIVVIETNLFKYIYGKISIWKLVAMTFNGVKQIKVVVISAIDENL